ncbi:PIG-L family deacetylase [Meiothermus sp. QL-1]|uniref:PIG-L deacetylase family protein n=1 Tax=Meiothermus sp. QL-1 TaxID=2058095 RepID=UPI000E09FA9C|nr:PIG-L deacetylase family protein [Meiothermus sp. QL-1]RDI94800.1 PIG-L family deacetylase [Meiothermus sp. QL-1]
MKRMLVFSAHAADFVWRAGGAIASVCAQGGQARVVALSYGERGESGELWKEPGQTVERVKAIRHAEATQAAEALGASFECLDLGDYPLRVDDKALERMVEIIVETAPDLLLTHAEKDPFNPDHPLTYQAVEKARQLATGAGVASAFRTVRPPEFLLFEPHQPELCGFVPTVFLDITPVWEKKLKAMEAFASQVYLRQYYSERAAHRANHARRIAGYKDIERAEAFQRMLPQVVRSL